MTYPAVIGWAIESQPIQRIAFDTGLDLCLVEARQGRAVEHPVQPEEALDRGIDRREGVVGAEQHLGPDAVLLHEHETVIELERAIVQCRQIGVDVAVFARHDDSLALVGMTDVGHDDPYFRKARCHGVEVAGQRAVDGCLGDEGGARVQQHGEGVFGGVTPERVEELIVRVEAGVHRQQLDTLHAELLVAALHLRLPAVLRGVDGEEADEAVRILRHVAGDVVVVHPQPGEPGLAAEDDDTIRLRAAGGVVGVESHCQIQVATAFG